MNVDNRALKVLTDWNAREYKNEGQKAASLQALIVSALKEQDKLTRHACTEKIAFIDDNPDHDVVLGNVIRKIMTTRAI